MLQKNINDIGVIWLDANVNNIENNLYQSDLFKQFNECYFLTNIPDYKNFIQQFDLMDGKKFYVIVSGSLGQIFMKQQSNSPLIIGVYIFCFDMKFHSQWSKNYEKVKGVQNEFEDIVKKMIAEYKNYTYNNTPHKHKFHYQNFEQNRDYVNFNFALKLSISYIQNDEQAKQRGLENLGFYCRKYIESYVNENEKEKSFNILDQLLIHLLTGSEKNPFIIEQFVDNSFIQPMINHVMQSRSLGDTFLIRNLIYELYFQMTSFKQVQPNYPKVLYLGTCLSVNEFEEWKEQKKSFFFLGVNTATSNKNNAKTQIEDAFKKFDEQEKINQIKVLIEIETNNLDQPLQLQEIVYYADDDQFLMQPNTFLHVKSVTNDTGLQLIRTKLAVQDDIGKAKKETEFIKMLQKIKTNENEILSFAALLQRLQIGQESIKILQSWEGQDELEESQRIHLIAKCYKELGNYQVALDYYLQCLDLQLKIYDEQKQFDITSIYSEIGQVFLKMSYFSDALQNCKKCLNMLNGEENADAAKNENIIGEVYLKMGNIQKANKHFQRSLEIYEKLENNQAKLNYDISVVYENIGNYPKALEKYEISFNKDLKFLGENNIDIAARYNKIGEIHQKMGNFNEALEYQEKSLRISLRLLGEQHTTIASIYNNMAIVYQNQCNYPKALEYYARSLQIELKLTGENFVNTANRYFNIGQVYELMGKFNKCLQYYSKSLEIRLQILGEKNTQTAHSYHNMGALYQKMGLYSTAIDLLNKSLSIQLDLFGEDNVDTASSFSIVGLVFYLLGNYSRAHENYERSLNIRLKLLGEDNVLIASSYDEIGTIHKSMNDYERALEFYEKALNIRVTHQGDSHIDTASSLNSIGVAYYFLGNDEKALDNIKKSLIIRRKLLGEDHIDTASSYSDLSLIYSTKDYQRALELQEKCLKTRINLLGENHPDIATSYYNIGAVYKNSADSSKALEYFEKSLKIRQQLLGDDHFETGNSYNSIGFIYQTQGDLENALENYQRCLKIWDNFFGQNHPNTINLTQIIESLKMNLQ